MDAWKAATREARVEAATERHLETLTDFFQRRRLREVIGNFRQHAIDRLHRQRLRLTLALHRRRKFLQRAVQGWRSWLSLRRETNFRSTILRTKLDLRAGFTLLRNLLLALQARNFRLARDTSRNFRLWREHARNFRSRRDKTHHLQLKALAANFAFLRVAAHTRKNLKRKFLDDWLDHLHLASLAQKFFDAVVMPRLAQEAVVNFKKISDHLTASNARARESRRSATLAKFFNFWTSEAAKAKLGFSELTRKFLESAGLRRLRENALLERGWGLLNRKFLRKNFQAWRVAPLVGDRRAKTERKFLGAWKFLVERIACIRKSQVCRFFRGWKFSLQLRLHRKFHALNVALGAWSSHTLDRKFSKISALNALAAWRDYAVVEWDAKFPIRKNFEKFRLATRRTKMRIDAADSLALKLENRKISGFFAFWRRRATTTGQGRQLQDELIRRESRKFLAAWWTKFKIFRLTKQRLFGPTFQGWSSAVRERKSEIGNFRKLKSFREFQAATAASRARRETLFSLAQKITGRESADLARETFKKWRGISDHMLHLEGVLVDRLAHMREHRRRWDGISGDPAQIDAFQNWRREFRRQRHLRKLASRVRLLVEGRVLARVLDRWCSLVLPPLRADTLHRRRCVRQFPVQQGRSPTRSPLRDVSSLCNTSLLAGLKRKAFNY